MQTLYHKKNELFEVEFFADKECTIPFDFTNAKNLYVELKNGDISPFLEIYKYTEHRNLYIPYMPNIEGLDFLPSFENIHTLDDITPNFSKYIPEDNAVLFLSEHDKKKYQNCVLTKTNSSYMVATFDNYILCSYDKQFPKNHNKATIFLPHGTQSELEKANEVAKELNEKYGVEEVNLCALHLFVEIKTDEDITDELPYYVYTTFQNCIDVDVDCIEDWNFNKIITTNSTGILKPEDSKERLQVIDCKEIFEDFLNGKII